MSSFATKNKYNLSSYTLSYHIFTGNLILKRQMPFISQTVAKCILEFQMFGKIVKTCCKTRYYKYRYRLGNYQIY